MEEVEEEVEKEEEVEEVELELEDLYITLSSEIRKKYKLKLESTKTNFGKVHCFVDDEGTVYKRFDDDEIGDIIGEWKEGNFFEC